MGGRLARLHSHLPHLLRKQVSQFLNQSHPMVLFRLILTFKRHERVGASNLIRHAKPLPTAGRMPTVTPYMWACLLTEKLFQLLGLVDV